MKYFVLISAILVGLSGCSSNEDANITKNNANTVAMPVSIPANANSLAATNASPLGMQPYNGIQNLNPNAFNATNDNLKVVPRQVPKDQLPIGSRIAPDNSVISSGSRGKDFYEARTFSNHPILAKVEKIMDGTTTKYKVYLKNGKVLDAPAEKMNDFEAVGPDNILDAVGMLTKPTTKSPANTDPKKELKQQ
jgi:hypothetical protein